MKKSGLPLGELTFVAIGEIIVSAAVVGVYLLLDKFDHTVVTGVILGSAVMLFNFIFLSLAINRAVDSVMAERGEGEMDEEQAAQFAENHRGEMNKAIKLSQMMRMVSVIGVLVVAFLIKQFNVIATLVPVVAFQPLLMLSGLILSGRKE